jgi:hypothetical protein
MFGEFRSVELRNEVAFQAKISVQQQLLKVLYAIHPKSSSNISILELISVFNILQDKQKKKTTNLLMKNNNIIACRAVSRQRLGKHVPLATDTNAIIVQQQRNGVLYVVRAEGL